MNYRTSALAVLVALLLFLPTAGGDKKNLTVSLERREIRDLTGQGLVLNFFIKVANVSDSPFFLEQVDYRVVVQEKDYFSLKTTLDEPIFVPARGGTSILLPVRITYPLLFEAVPGLEKEFRVSSYVTGLMMFSDGRRIREKLPFAFSADFPIFRELEAEIDPLEVNALSLGGAEFTFTFALKNPNGFDLEVERACYGLKLEGREVAGGELLAGARIESQNRKKVSLLLTLDFFELGRDLQAVLEQPAAECEFVVELDASSVWGRVKVEVSRKGVVTIEKKGDDLGHHPNL